MTLSDSRTTYLSLSVFREPFCLIENGPDGTLKICEEVLNELKQIRSPVNVIAIAGPYRTGKSYLLNYLAGKRTGFPLGSSIRAKTKGIWVWCKPHPNRIDEVLLLLDTEGLGDVMKGDEENDNWIFALSVLLSSTLVYNCFSTISQDGLAKLHYVTELTKRIKARDKSRNEKGKEFFKFFPNFVWVLRDFDLDMEDEEGKSITADEYLACALQLKEGTSPKIDNYNKPRRCIHQFFEDKRCFVFPKPVPGPGELKQLEKLSDSQLQPTFLRAAEEFCSYIYTRTFPKTAKGQPIHGKMFCHLLETYLDVIQGGEIPCVENAVKNMAERENAEAAEVSFNVYEENMKKRLQESIKTEEDLSMAHLDCSSKALERFMSMSILDEKQKSHTHLKERMGRTYKEICSQWERDHGGSESVKDDLEKKNKQLRTEAEESNQHLLQLQKKLQQEKENALKEIERKEQQRVIELKALEERNCELSKLLFQQAEQLAFERKNVESDLKTISEGGEGFALFLKISGSTLTAAIAGALTGARIGLLSGNPLIMAVATIMGGVFGAAYGFVVGTVVTTWW